MSEMRFGRFRGNVVITEKGALMSPFGPRSTERMVSVRLGDREIALPSDASWDDINAALDDLGEDFAARGKA